MSFILVVEPFISNFGKERTLQSLTHDYIILHSYYHASFLNIVLIIQ